MTEHALAVVERHEIQQLPAVPVTHLLARVSQIREVQEQVMKEGHHYGKIPGVDKPTLLKPGAEMLCLTFQMGRRVKLDERHDGDHLEVIATVELFHMPTGADLGSGVGSCSTKESKYAWRKGERTCPECGKAAIIKGKAEFGGGWLCWGKKGGCGAKWDGGDKAIEGQQTDRVPNPDLADQYNTVRKMAVKRALVDATLFVSGASELFTQDVEDLGGDSKPEPKNGKPPANQKSNGRPQATQEQLDEQLSLIRSADTPEDLDRLRTRLHVKWGREFTQQLQDAERQRRAELRMEDYDTEDEEATGAAEGPF